MRASRTLKPLNQYEETLSCRRKKTDPSRNLAFFDKSQAGHYLHLVYVQSRAPKLRDLTRTRKQLTREIVQHVQRIQAVLEEANVKLSSVISDIMGQPYIRYIRWPRFGRLAFASCSWPRPTKADGFLGRD